MGEFMDINLIEVKKELDELAVSLKNKTTDKDIAKRFRETIFVYVYFLIIQKTSQEDLAGDYFLDRIKIKLDDLFNRYDEKQGEFSNFLNSFIFRSFEYYKKSILIKENPIEILIRNRLLDATEEEQEEDDEEENKELTKKINEKLLKNIKITNAIQDAFKVFLLRHAMKISEEGIRNFCSIFKIDLNYMETAINRGRALINRNIEKINFHQERNNYYRFNNLEIKEKIRNIKTLMQANPNDSERKDLEKRLLELNKKYNKNNKMLNMHKRKIEKLLVLSYKDISDILQIKCGNIRASYHTAKKELIRIEKAIRKDTKEN